MSDDETKQTKKQAYDKQWRLDNKEHVTNYKKQSASFRFQFERVLENICAIGFML